MVATLAPFSARELRDAVRQARRFNCSRLDRVLRLDTGRGVVEVQANTAWKQLAAHLRPADEKAAAVRTIMPTVGGSIACNAAGPDGRPVVTHVESLTLVTPDGELRRVSRLSNPQLFARVVGGHGLFGALYSVTLRLESLARALLDTAPVEMLQLPQGGVPTRSLQLLVPPEELDGFMAESRERCAEWRIALESVEVRRTLAEADSYLRWASRPYAEITLRMGAPGTLGGTVRATQLRRQLIDAAIARRGAFPIACTPEATRVQTEACYPQLRSFLAEKRSADPTERLTNDWYRHYKNLLGRESCDVRWAN